MTKKPFAKKSLGQNFLVDQNIIRKIVEAAELAQSEMVVEIGPGRGALTEYLIKEAGSVVAIELDRELVPLLRGKFTDTANFEVLEADILKVDLRKIFAGRETYAGVKLIANLPYYISTAVLQKLIENRGLFCEFILMFQKEVVDRITAKPGSSDRGYLTVMVEAFLDVEKLFEVPPAAFRPVPKVQSAVARLIPKKQKFELSDDFAELVSAGFRQKRKTLFNNLKNFKGLKLTKVAFSDPGVQDSARAEDLTLDDWISLDRWFKLQKAEGN